MKMDEWMGALPSDLVNRFEQAVAPDQRVSALTEALQEWMSTHSLLDLHQEIIEGCREMDALNLEIEGEYHPLEEEVERAAAPSS